MDRNKRKQVVWGGKEKGRRYKKKTNEKRIEVMPLIIFSATAALTLGAVDTRPAKYQVETKE
jgi:hypothetical protein